jgi:hypothetical protein
MTIPSSIKAPVAADPPSALPSSAPPKEQRPAAEDRERARPAQPAVPEIGGPQGPEPTRYGDWEKGGRCTDF